MDQKREKQEAESEESNGGLSSLPIVKYVRTNKKPVIAIAIVVVVAIIVVFGFIL